MIEFVKVWLPGETPWAEVVRPLPDGGFLLRIANTLVGESAEMRKELAREWFTSDEPLPKLHDYKFGELIACRRVKGRNNLYVPIELADKISFPELDGED